MNPNTPVVLSERAMFEITEPFKFSDITLTEDEILSITISVIQDLHPNNKRLIKSLFRDLEHVRGDE